MSKEIKYQSVENTSGKPVMWYVDLSCYEVEAMTSHEAEAKVLAMIKEEDPEICEISLVELQERRN